MIILLSLTVMVIMSKEDDNRNKVVEAAGTAVVGAGLLGGLLFGGAVLAKAVGDAARDNERARSNGGNVVRLSSPPAPNSNDHDGKCDYDCSGWPYQECKVTQTFKYGGFKSATCISPYSSRSSYRMFSNYPECATIPSECERCDDVCSKRDGVRNSALAVHYTETGPGYAVAGRQALAPIVPVIYPY